MDDENKENQPVNMDDFLHPVVEIIDPQEEGQGPAPDEQSNGAPPEVQEQLDSVNRILESLDSERLSSQQLFEIAMKCIDIVTHPGFHPDLIRMNLTCIYSRVLGVAFRMRDNSPQAGEMIEVYREGLLEVIRASIQRPPIAASMLADPDVLQAMQSPREEPQKGPIGFGSYSKISEQPT